MSIPGSGDGAMFPIGSAALERRGGQFALTAPESLDNEDWRIRHLARNGKPITTGALTIKREDGTVVPPPPQAAPLLRPRAARPVAAEAEDDEGEGAEEFDDVEDVKNLLPAFSPIEFDDDGFDDDDDDLKELRLPPPRARRTTKKSSHAIGTTIVVVTPDDLTRFYAQVTRQISALQGQIEEQIAASERRIIKRVKRLLAELVADDE